MPFYTFSCSNRHRTRRLVPLDTEIVVCSCGAKGERVADFGASIVVDPARVPPDQQRHNVSLFREATEERAYLCDKAEAQLERSLPSRPLWQEAKRQADLVRRGLAPPPSNTR